VPRDRIEIDPGIQLLSEPCYALVSSPFKLWRRRRGSLRYAGCIDMQARPKTVPIVAAFLFAAAAIAAMVGFSLLFPNPLLDRLWHLNPEGAVFFHSIGRVSGVFLLGLGTAMLFAARALLRGQLWAWWFAIALFTAEAVSNPVSYFVIHDALRAVTGFFIAAMFLLALCGRRARDYFFRRNSFD
jgi:hypothetical protein